MPELPEVETTRRGLLSAMKGARIAKAELKRHDLRFPFPKDFEARLKGRNIKTIRRRAKYLLFDLDNGEVLLAHLGMSGSFRVVKEKDYKPRKHDHVLLHLVGGKVCVFHDPRRFGLMDLIKKGGEGSHKLLTHLGPEPLSKDFSPEYLQKALLKRKGPIKPVLMDQKLVVGVGNIYASEALHVAKIYPDTPANKLGPKVVRLIHAIHRVLEAAIASGGSTLRDYLQVDGEAGYFQHQFHVYERSGDACATCGGVIKSAVHAGRTTYWCPTCQPKRAKARKP